MNSEDGSQQTYEDKYSVIHEWLGKVDVDNTEYINAGEAKFKVFGFNLPDEKKTRVSTICRRRWSCIFNVLGA